MRKSITRGAIIIAVGGLICKIIGAVYRVPLTLFLGAEGIGLYQMVFPTYCALLTLSSNGIPMALSKLIASTKRNGYFAKSVFIFGLLGLCGSVIMCVLGGFFARLQGNVDARMLYVALSPSVFLVSLISCIRGYFQGKENMMPTAVSQIIEQIVKSVVGLTACWYFKHNLILASVMATLAVSISELFALAYLYIRLKISGYKRTDAGKGLSKSILKLTIPVTLMAIMLPLGHLMDSFLVVNLLGGGERATELYGVYSGNVASIIGVPVSLAYGIAIAFVPAIARGGGDVDMSNSMRFTGFIAIPFVFFFLFFARECILLLYGSLPHDLILTASNILALDAISVFSLSFLQTTNATLVAKGKQKIPLISMGIALIIRVILCVVLVSNKNIGIHGAVISANISYLTAVIINLSLCLSKTTSPLVLYDFAKTALISIICVLGGYLLKSRFSGTFAFVLISFTVAIVYFIISILIKFFEDRDAKRRKRPA